MYDFGVSLHHHPRRHLRLLELSEFLDLPNLHLRHRLRWGLVSSVSMSWNCSLNSFRPSWQGLPSLRRVISSSWLPSVAQVITQDTNVSRVISFDNYSHVDEILFLSIDFSDIAITVLLLFFTLFALSNLFMLCKRFKLAPIFEI